jgi:hypothetical protein
MKITNLQALKQALEALKHKHNIATNEQGVEVRGWKGAKMNAEISIDMGKYDVGVVKNEQGTYDLVADWWGIETTQGITEKEFQQELNQQYAYQRVLIACEEQGYSSDNVVTKEDGTIQLMMKKWE